MLEHGETINVLGHHGKQPLMGVLPFADIGVLRTRGSSIACIFLNTLVSWSLDLVLQTHLQLFSIRVNVGFSRPPVPVVLFQHQCLDELELRHCLRCLVLVCGVGVLSLEVGGLDVNVHAGGVKMLCARHETVGDGVRGVGRVGRHNEKISRLQMK